MCPLIYYLNVFIILYVMNLLYDLCDENISLVFVTEEVKEEPEGKVTGTLEFWAGYYE